MRISIHRDSGVTVGLRRKIELAAKWQPGFAWCESMVKFQ
jgi:hypothetical protein